MAEQRDRIYTYTSTASFLAKRHLPCRHMTSECPNNCGHAKDVFAFRLDHLNVHENKDSPSLQWCTPVEQGSEHMVPSCDLEKFSSVANLLIPGDKVKLDWNHDYVTAGGCSCPQRPVVTLAKVD